MIEIAGLFIYPVKSCRGISLQEAQLGPRGFLHDREFLVVDETATFITQRNAPELATVEISLQEKQLRLRTPSQSELCLSLVEDERSKVMPERRTATIFRDTVLADDAGDDAAKWFSEVLQRRCRLVRLGVASSRAVPLERIPPAHRAAQGPQVSFTDAFPTLLISEESVRDLNTRLTTLLPINRFRPNIVVRGCGPYDENTWDVIRAGSVEFVCATTCLRCVITTIDQQTGTRDGTEPLATLATYRCSPDGNGVIFGAYLIHGDRGKVRTGQTLIVEPKKPNE